MYYESFLLFLGDMDDVLMAGWRTACLFKIGAKAYWS